MEDTRVAGELIKNYTLESKTRIHFPNSLMKQGTSAILFAAKQSYRLACLEFQNRPLCSCCFSTLV